MAYPFSVFPTMGVRLRQPYEQTCLSLNRSNMCGADALSEPLHKGTPVIRTRVRLTQPQLGLDRGQFTRKRA